MTTRTRTRRPTTSAAERKIAAAKAEIEQAAPKAEKAPRKPSSAVSHPFVLDADGKCTTCGLEPTAKQAEKLSAKVEISHFAAPKAVAVAA